MARYKAVTGIKYSDPNADPGADKEIVTFEAGDTVTGLPKETMKELWDAGALEKVEEAPAPTPTPVVAEGGSGGGAEDTPLE